jgi:hypothetical protein
LKEKFAEKAKFIEEFTNKLRNMDKAYDKLADKIEKINTVEECKKGKS